MQSFIELAEECVAVLQSGLPVLEAYPLLRQVEPKRVAEYGNSSWPGCLFKLDRDEFVIATSQPHLDQFHDARFPSWRELPPADDAELREHFIRVLSAWIREAKRLQKNVQCLVTLQQCAAIVQRSKRTLERMKTAGSLPLPAVDGGGGRPDEYDWSKIRPVLEAEFGRKLPEKFPSLHQI